MVVVEDNASTPTLGWLSGGGGHQGGGMALLPIVDDEGGNLFYLIQVHQLRVLCDVLARRGSSGAVR